MSTRKAVCPHCDARFTLDLQAVETGNVVECANCAAALEVRSLDPLRFKVQEVVESSWDDLEFPEEDHDHPHRGSSKNQTGAWEAPKEKPRFRKTAKQRMVE